MDRKIYLTNLGKDLISEAAKGGYEFQILRVILGNGLTHAGKSQEELEKVTRIESPKAYLNEISIEKQSPNIILARAKLNTSEVISESFRASETGLIARLKKSDGTYYPSEEGILHEYRNIGEEGDWIPSKASGEAWSLSYSITTVVSNAATIIPTIKGDITREEFEAHVNSESPHKRFMITGKEVSKIDYVNVNYAGSGNAIDFISFEKFKDSLDNAGNIVDTYIEKDKVKALGAKNEYISDEVISNTTPNDINNFYCTDWISGFESINKVPYSEGIALVCKPKDFNAVKKFVNDNQLIHGQELTMINGEDEVKVIYCGLNEDIIFAVSEDPGELNNPKFTLTTAIVVSGKVFPNKLFENKSLNIKTPGLDWTDIKPSPGKTTKTDKYVVGNYADYNLAGNITQWYDTFEVSSLHNEDYFNAWNFNDNINNLVSSGLSLSAAGTLSYENGLFGNKAIKPAVNNFAYNSGSYDGFYNRIINNKDFWFEAWIKPNELTSQVIYNEFQSLKKEFPIEDDVIFFANFDGDTHEERMKDKIFGQLPVIGFDEDSTTSGGIPNTKETPYKFEKINSRYIWLLDPNKMGQGNFTFEYINSSDMLNDNGICAGLGYVYEKDGVKGFTAIALHDLTGKTQDHDNFRCYRPNVLPVDSEGVLTEEWKFEGTNYQNLSFNEIPGSEPHWYTNHYCWHFSYTDEDGINLTSNMFKRSSSVTIDDVATKELEEQTPYGGQGTYSYKVTIPEGAKFLGVGVIIECPPNEGYYYGGWADQIRIRKGIIDKTRAAGKILPVSSSYDYKTISYREAPVYKVALSNEDLILERFTEFSGSGDGRVAKVIKCVAKVNLKVNDWNHIVIKDENKVPELFIGPTKITWISQETIDYRFDEEFVKKYIHLLIGGESINDLEAPTEIKSGIFNGLIQDLGAGNLNNDFTPLVPLLPIMSSEARGMAYATNTNQAIPYYNPLVSGTSELVKMISSEETGDIHIAFRKEKAINNGINLYRLAINSSGKIELESIGTVGEQLYEIADVIKTSGNKSLTEFLGKEFEVETPDEKLYLYPYIVLSNAETKVSNIEIDKITTTTNPIYTFEDEKQLDFDELKQIYYLKETIDSSSYDSMTLKYYGLNENDEWEELSAGLQSKTNNYKSLKAHLNVDFSQTHKDDGFLKFKSVNCVVKNNLLVTPGDNSYLSLKPIIFNGNLKQIHSFIKYTNYDMKANDIYNFKIRHGVVKKNIEIVPYAHKIYLEKINVLMENVLKKPGASAPEKLLINNGIKIIVTNELGEYVKEITDFTVAYEVVNNKVKLGISIPGSINSEDNLNIIYYTVDLSDWITLNKVSDSNYLNSILLQYSKAKITGSNIIIPKIEIKTNDYIDFVEDTGVLSSGKVETFTYNLKRNVLGVKVLLNNIELPDNLVTLIKANNYLIIKADLRTQLLNNDISIKFKYLGNDLIDGFSDLGILLT